MYWILIIGYITCTGYTLNIIVFHLYAMYIQYQFTVGSCTLLKSGLIIFLLRTYLVVVTHVYNVNVIILRINLKGLGHLINRRGQEWRIIFQ